jgi:hypothetical protein
MMVIIYNVNNKKKEREKGNIIYVYNKISIDTNAIYIRDQPFNLKGGRSYCFCIVQNFFFRTTQLLEYFFFQNLTLGYTTKTLNKIFFFSSTKIKIFFSATLGIRIFFLEKNHNPLQVKWSFP